MKRKSAKPGFMPRSFYEWLHHLEQMEYSCTHLIAGKRTKPVGYYVFSDELFRQVGNMDDTVTQMAPIDAYLARVVRSSVKFCVDFSVLEQVTKRYEREMLDLFETMEIHLPYPWCTLVIRGLGPDDVVVSLMETESDQPDPMYPGKLKDYPELGVKAGEKFISVSLAFYRPTGVLVNGGTVPDRNQRISNVPVEIHMNKGMTMSEAKCIFAMATGIQCTEKGEHWIEVIRLLILRWLAMIQLSTVLRRRQVGVPPLPNAHRVPRHKPDRHRKPMFEHFVIEMEVDEPEAEQTGRTVFQPRKRLHQVRSFWRHYKSGKVKLIESHWRGDPALGVVVKDYDMHLHEETT
jgi:hypothetical protein